MLGENVVWNLIVFFLLEHFFPDISFIRFATMTEETYVRAN